VHLRVRGAVAVEAYPVFSSSKLGLERRAATASDQVLA
jgi:hypothetical protein